MPGKIDAAFTYKNGKTYFFKVTRSIILLFIYSIQLLINIVTSSYIFLDSQLFNNVINFIFYFLFYYLSRGLSTGGTSARESTVIIRRISARDSLEFPTTLTPSPCGRETEKFISTRELNSGDLILLNGRQLKALTRNLFLIGKECPIIWTRRSRITGTRISSKIMRTIGLTTGHSR